jgi:hypothetical protein
MTQALVGAASGAMLGGVTGSTGQIVDNIN